jgi:HAE1 family hydrophobic/amphiphilic exporter-1
MIDSGTLAPVELVAAEAELERRRDTYYAAVGLVTEIENGLKTLLSSSRSEDIWNEALVPAEERAPESPAAADLNSAVTQALARRPELRQIGLRRDTNGIEREMAADTRKVRLDLNLTYLNSGLAGTENPNENPFARSNTATLARINQLSAAAGLPPISIPSFAGTPPQFVGGYGQVLSGVFGGNYQTVQAGLTMDFLPTNRAADAAIAQTAIAERRLKLETQRVEQAIVAQVRNGLQAIETARQRIAAAEASARAAKEKMESETRLFQSGESTNFLVLTRQNEYADSLRRAVAARLDLNKAVARLQQATGTTLEIHRLRVTE